MYRSVASKDALSLVLHSRETRPWVVSMCTPSCPGCSACSCCSLHPEASLVEILHWHLGYLVLCPGSVTLKTMVDLA